MICLIYSITKARLDCICLIILCFIYWIIPKISTKILDYSFSVVNTLNKQTVVEGVETKEQLDLLIEYGATYIQGYYFSKPLEFNSYIEFLREN